MLPSYIVRPNGTICTVHEELERLKKANKALCEVMFSIEYATDRYGEVGKSLARVARRQYVEGED